LIAIPHIIMGYVRKTSRVELSSTLKARIWERYDCTKNVSAVAAHFKQRYFTVSFFINRFKKCHGKAQAFSLPSSPSMRNLLFFSEDLLMSSLVF
jgi:hypothetical protein